MPIRRGMGGSVGSGASMELRPSVLSPRERHKALLAADLGDLAREGVAEEVVHVGLGHGVVVGDEVAVVAAGRRVLSYERGENDAERRRVAADRSRVRSAG